MRRLLLPAFLWLAFAVLATCTVRGQGWSLSSSDGGSAGITLVISGKTALETGGWRITFSATGSGGKVGRGTNANLPAAVYFLGAAPAIFTADISGPVTFWAWAGDVAHAQYRTYDPTVATQRVRVALHNNSDFPVTYKLMQDGEQIGTVTLQSRQGIIQEFDAPSSSEVVVMSEVEGIVKDGPIWVVEEGAVTDLGPVKTITPHDADGPTPEPTDVPEPNIPRDTPSNNSGKGTWTVPSTNTDPANQTDLLTNKIYMQGADKITSAVSKISDSLRGSSPVLNSEATTIQTDPVAFHSVTGSGLIPASAPTFFSGSIPSVSVVSATLPQFSVLGQTWPQKTWSFDLASYSASITWFRAVCSVALWLSWWLLLVRTARGAAADT